MHQSEVGAFLDAIRKADREPMVRELTTYEMLEMQALNAAGFADPIFQRPAGMLTATQRGERHAFIKSEHDLGRSTVFDDATLLPPPGFLDDPGKPKLRVGGAGTITGDDSINVYCNVVESTDDKLGRMRKIYERLTGKDYKEMKCAVGACQNVATRLLHVVDTRFPDGSAQLLVPGCAKCNTAGSGSNARHDYSGPTSTAFSIKKGAEILFMGAHPCTLRDDLTPKRFSDRSSAGSVPGGAGDDLSKHSGLSYYDGLGSVFASSHSASEVGSDAGCP